MQSRERDILTCIVAVVLINIKSGASGTNILSNLKKTSKIMTKICHIICISLTLSSKTASVLRRATSIEENVNTILGWINRMEKIKLDGVGYSGMDEKKNANGILDGFNGMEKSNWTVLFFHRYGKKEKAKCFIVLCRYRVGISTSLLSTQVLKYDS